MRIEKYVWFGVTALLLQGCAALDPRENVIFFTKTSLGVDVDGTPPEASFAYSRIEGFLGPRYDNGAVPPVASYLQTDGGLFDRNVTQMYATGRAATLVAGDDSGKSVSTLKGAKKAMFFGTSTTFGVRISFAATGAEGLVLGYRRKELSYIPIGTHEGTDQYASVIGVFSSDAAASTLQESKIGVSQYFATGAAAEKVAAWPETRTAFRQSGNEALGKYRESVARQDSEVVRILRCFAYVEDGKFPAVLDNANDLKLFQDDKAFGLLKAEKDTRKARAEYVDEIGISIGAAADRSTRLLRHRVHVCGLVKQP